MPVSVSVRNIRQRPSVRALETGGYERVSIPNPNDPMEQYRGMTRGSRGSPQQASAQNDPRRAVSVSALRDAANKTDYEDLTNYEANLDSMHGSGQPLDTVSRVVNRLRSGTSAQSSWRPYLQALKDKGVDKLSTGAVTLGSDLGFFDRPAPSMSGLRKAYR